VVALIDIHDIGQIGTIFGIMAILITTFFQLRNYKKEQRELAERNRESITKEINEKTAVLFERIEGRLEAIKIAALVTTEDIIELKKQLEVLRDYVMQLDKTGTVEWQKTKPLIMERIDTLQNRLNELEERINSFRLKREQIERDIERAQSYKPDS